MASELGPARTPGAAEPELGGKRKYGWWEFLNSQALLALLLAIAGGAWNVWQYVENKQKDDAQFLGSMLPYLTDNKIETRVRAIQIIEGRYSELEDIPGNVRNLMCHSVTDFADFRHQMSNALIDDVDAFWITCQSKTGPSTPQDTTGVTPTRSPAVAQMPAARARVYIQIYSEEQRESAAEVQQSLRNVGYVVPGIEDLSNTNPTLASRPVSNTEVRYFNDADADAAGRIYKSLTTNKSLARLSKQGAMRRSLRANRGTIEIWFAPGDGVIKDSAK